MCAHWRISISIRNKIPFLTLSTNKQHYSQLLFFFFSWFFCFLFYFHFTIHRIAHTMALEIAAAAISKVKAFHSLISTGNIFYNWTLATYIFWIHYILYKLCVRAINVYCIRLYTCLGSWKMRRNGVTTCRSYVCLAIVKGKIYINFLYYIHLYSVHDYILYTNIIFKHIKLDWIDIIFFRKF